MNWLRNKLRKWYETVNMTSEERYYAQATDLCDLERRMKEVKAGNVNRNHPFYYL